MKKKASETVLKTVELFCGIGGFRVAADALNIRTVWANDIEERAAVVYTKNFGRENFYQGDIRNVLNSIPNHDILTAGFPCQPFSSAGKKMGIGDPRGTLFSEIVRILYEKKPKFFVLENVKRLLSMDSGRHFKTILDSLTQAGYLVEWRVLNTIWFGLPQYRERVILVGYRNGDLRSYLYQNDQELKRNPNYPVKFKSDSIQTIIEHQNKFKSWGLAWKNFVIDQEVKHPPCCIHPEIRLHHILEESPNLTFFFTEDTLKRIENSERVFRYFNGVEILYNQKGGARMGYSIFGINGVAPTLTSTTSRHYERYKIGNHYRRLTNVEYARLQGFPDGHCQEIPPYHQYRLFGNAVPPPLVKWVMNRLVQEHFSPVILNQPVAGKQLELFLD
ncbi:DNA (cytosine-5-)-methyltransferase [Spirulina major CS-329]|uniref:DNA cytosine methyltransferase n=1 Tax=Spirulina TaxID=1154 RepID=UPI00233121BE|nr:MULTISPECIES: DNA (cytosine-5-)-methyltransferase [Spirulina]MDB9493645.1 DNA (cytosine-5-)-methyltransferase [Spirulina subsalsa CS-330]MDB9504426.1 DNA (cytosine-5-)-methyltransferase [Spirulina major CS-329]